MPASAPIVGNCLAGPSICTTVVNAPLGSDTFTVVLYDQPNAAGNALGAGVTQLAVVAGSNTLAPALGAVVAKTSLSASLAANAGKPATFTLRLDAVNTDGNKVQGTDPFVTRAAVRRGYR